MTAEEYDSLFEQQNGVCAICFQPETHFKFLAVDHNHITGEIRGLLCHSCNLSLGGFGDDPVTVLRAYHYLTIGR